MKENREFDMLENADDKTVELLAEVPVLTEDEKKRMLAMSRKKLDRMNRESNIKTKDGEDVVSGVERYHRPKWQRFAAAAACLALAGGAVGAALKFGRHREQIIDPVTEPTTAAITMITTTVPATEEKTEPEELTELEKEVKAMLDKFNNLNALANGRIDKTVELYQLPAETHLETYNNTSYTYCEVNEGPEYIDKIRNDMNDILTGDMLSEFDSRLLTGEIPFLKEIDGKLCLYSYTAYDRLDYTMFPLSISLQDCEISNTGEDSFDLFVDYGQTTGRAGVNIHAVSEDGKWKFSSYDTVMDDSVKEELQEAAGEVLERFRTLDAIYHGNGVEIDKNDSFTNNNNVYYRVTDERFSTVDDVAEFVTDITTGTILNLTYSSLYDAVSFNYPAFKVSRDKLYFCETESEITESYSGEPELCNVYPDAFDVKVDSETKYGDNPQLFRFTMNNGKWKIYSIESYYLHTEFDPANGDPETIARNATAVLNEVLNVSFGAGVEVDENDFIISSYGDQPECVYKRVTDPRFSSLNDVRAYIYERTCQSLKYNLIDRSVGGGENYSSTVYLEKNGKLYCYYDPTSAYAFDFTGEVEILDSTEYTISSRPHVVPEGYGGELMLMFLEHEDGVWKISSYKYM